MDKNLLLKTITRRADKIWRELCRDDGRLLEFRPPKIALNNRLWRTAAWCYQEQNLVELGTKFLLYSPEYRDYMLDVILPHELIHQADYALHGPSELPCGHGLHWQEMMHSYGLPSDPFHYMEITR